jgi:hypothetical protein
MMIVHGLILILLVSVVPSNSLQCYECRCELSDLTACNCGDTSDSTEIDYCVIYEDRYPDATYIDLTRVPRNVTWLYIEDTYFMLAQESIRYNLTASQWYLWTSAIIFGCDWDLCNDPDLITSLPDTFKLSIDTNWLDTNIYGTGNTTGCNQCPTYICGDNDNPINITQCSMASCGNVTTVI